MEQVLEKHNLSEVKKNLSGLVSKVETSGIPFVISRYGKPVAIVASYDENHKIAPKLKGSLNKYANKALINAEKQAWKKAACNK